MPSPIASIITGAHAALAGVAGTPVDYIRGEQSVAIAKAVRGRSEFEVTDENGFLTNTNVQDFLLLRSQLVLGGIEVEPQAGDRIREIVNHQLIIHEVMSPGGAEPAWRWSDGDRTRYRIHTRLVSSEPEEEEEE